MFCTCCGKELEKGWEFCMNCGEPIVLLDGVMDGQDDMQSSDKNASQDQMQASDQYNSQDQMQTSDQYSSQDQMQTSDQYDSQDQMQTSDQYNSQDQMQTSDQYNSQDQMQSYNQYNSQDQMQMTDQYGEQAAEMYGNQADNMSGAVEKQSGGVRKIMPFIAAALAVVVVILGGLLYFVKNGSDVKIDVRRKAFTIFVKDAESDSDIKNASISIYEGRDNTEGDPVCSISLADSDQESEDEVGYKTRKLKDGDYTILVSAEGYIPYTGNITATESGSEDVHMTPLPEEGTYLFMVDWNGSQDLDLCIYDDEEKDYFSVGNMDDNDIIRIREDNSGEDHHEIAYVKANSPNVCRKMYVVDTNAAKSDTDSSMEQDGVTVTVYDSNGECSAITADSDENSPIWNFASIDNGDVDCESPEYMSDCATKNSWSQYLKEGQTQRRIDKITHLNTSSDAIPLYDPSVDNYSPAPRTGTKVWDMTVFYAMEQHQYFNGYYDKNFCVLKKVEAISALTGNVVDFDIYLNPVTMLPNKIVSIEYWSNGIEVYEYYYENDGKVSFIFKYTTDNYVSTYATVGKSGERFLFKDDNLTTWRIVRSPGDVDNFCFGADEEARLHEGSWAKKSIKEYSTLGESVQRSYDDVEKKMINYAYNTYNMVLDAEGIGKIIGVVYSGDYTPYQNAEVEVYDKKFNTLLYSTKPDANGEYSIYVPMEEYNYNIRINGGNDSTECNIYDVNIDGGTLKKYVDSVLLFPQNEQEQRVSLYIGDAFKGYGTSVGNADIYVRNGINNRNGDVCLTTSTDTNGRAEFYLVPGVYTIEAEKSGYESIYYTIVSNPNEQNTYQYYTPPTLSEGEYAIVLSWGQYPRDLDSHLFTSTDNNNYHVWYSDTVDSLSNYLDVDDIDSYGPETITIRKFNENNYYKYCVIDYTNSSSGYYNSTEMSYSDATVNVYSAGGHLATYHVPVNRNGVVWEVFEIRNGILTPIQRYYNDMDNQNWWNRGY